MITKRPTPWLIKDALTAIVVPLLFQLGYYLTVGVALRFRLMPDFANAFFRSESSLLRLSEYGIALLSEVIVLVWLVAKRHATRRDLGLTRFRWQWLFIVFGLYGLQLIMIFALYAILQTLIPSINLDETQEVFEFGLSHWGIIFSFIATVLVAPIIEEVIFRGLIFPALATRWRMWIAAMISSAIFALMHGQLNVGIYTFVFGILLCWMYQRSGSIIPGIVLHFMNNLIAFWALASVGAHLL
ncbi:CPBP family intramembrane metalloprotease [Candidatus Saccharibacteria bacterium]|nr:CPBP family intramembrane metalloprotease [Candidatus Saccharibacteria bacterium]